MEVRQGVLDRVSDLTLEKVLEVFDFWCSGTARSSGTKVEPSVKLALNTYPGSDAKVLRCLLGGLCG